MVHWSHTPYISINSQYTLPRTFPYLGSPLGSLNGPYRDTLQAGRAGVLYYPDSLLPLPVL